MYRVSVRNYYCGSDEEDDERIDARMTHCEVYAWMLDSDMRHVFDYGSYDHFLLRSEGCPGCGDDDLADTRAFIADARRVLGVVDDADNHKSLYAAYAGATPDAKAVLAEAYARHLDAQAWVDDVVSWCALHPGEEYDMVGNQSIVGTITTCLQWPPPSKI
ncbi:hypothetical protein pneo_cds_993 [Pandoravirus neocaledonia]|uniref:Uncharacterized protein n=1 Tax=Pandoravirus neocaledonia TaxID=2107708 RepID=A0A2U7UE54_9VIRU|nr:hypothetical protein pneo_cds_993 [Pandoravirus neocaledonia]AVK76600.1 hypothetical protein pneo_cds_993 [Pandoravirus neocaledonia]